MSVAGVQPVIRRSAVAAVLVVVASSLCGCSAGGHSDAVVDVTPTSTLMDEPIQIVVTGLRSGQKVTLRMSSTDSQGVGWASAATFEADTDGTVDVGRSPAVGGSYRGLEPMGLIDTMQPAGGGDSAYFWGQGQPMDFDLTASTGHTVLARKSFQRLGTAPGVTVHPESMATTGFYGQYWSPAPGTPTHPGVLEFGGSEGGLDGQLLGSMLASAGYPTLDIAYFGEAGLPSALSDIPLEYFTGALRWLAAQPAVNRRQIWVLGSSRGSEAALLLGAYYPDLVHGVIAGSPSDVSLCSYPRCSGAVWTLHGRPLPYTSLVNDPDPYDTPAAVIPVARINGPVFLDCGTADQVWASCDYAKADMAHLDSAHDRWPHVLYQFTGAGHFVADLVPYEPQAAAFSIQHRRDQGATPLADNDADARLWADLQAFLANPSSESGVITASA